MTQDNQQTEHQQEEHPEHTKPAQTPLEMVKEQQAVKQQNREVSEQRVESSSEVPGHGVPSERRKHPHRQLG